MRKRQEIDASDSSDIRFIKDEKDKDHRLSVWNWNGEGKNIALLFFLYLLQGIPLGLAASIPLLLQNRKVSYKEQAEFSFVYWPFSLKLLWAPIIDSLYSSRMGRRKTWLVPVQYVLGFSMLFLSTRVNSYLDSDGQPNIQMLTLVFFILNFLAATQDIAVDGWALTMLHRSNVGYASTCNSVGQTAGYFLGYVLFVAFESADFCNKYLRTVPQPNGLLTLDGFLYFWGMTFLISTTLVWLLKTEKKEEIQDDLSIAQTYKLLMKIFKLPAIQWTVVILMTARIGFSADAVTALKLVEKGVPKAQLALLLVPLVPLQIILPLLISRYTTGPRPMEVYLKAIPYRLMFGLVYAGLVWITPSFKGQDGQFPFYYYLLVLVIYALHQITVYSMFVAIMAFFAKVSDPAVGGTYMTLLNTVCNLGGNWPSTLALWSVDSLTWKSCQGSPSEGNSCLNPAQVLACTENGGHCATQLDGYYVESVVCIVFGFVWLRWGGKIIKQLQSKDESAWKVQQ